MIQQSIQMKTVFTSVLLFIFYLSGNCTIKTVVSNSGVGWGRDGNWSPSGVPESGDEVIIPLGMTISVKASFYNGTGNLKIQVYGVLDFDPSGKLDLAAASTLQLYTPTSLITTNGSGSERILINGVLKYHGSVDGTVSGPKYASLLSGVSPGGFGVGVLPVKLIHFSAQKGADKVLLTWKTAEETGTTDFIVERSLNASNWQPVGTLSAKGTNSNYQLTDEHPANGENFYRLKITDDDGYYEYSGIRKVFVSSENAVRVGPNPAYDRVTVYFADASTAGYSVQLFNSSGGNVNDHSLSEFLSNAIRINTSALSKGVYYLNILYQQQVVKTAVIQKR